MNRESCFYQYLFPSKFLYWCLHGAIGSMLPYYNVFFVSNSLSIQQAGIISGIRFFLSGISTIVFGVIADRKQNKKMLIIILISMEILILALLPFATYAIRKNENLYTINNSNYNQSYNCINQTQSSCNPGNIMVNVSHHNNSLTGKPVNAAAILKEKFLDSHYNFNKRSNMMFFTLLLLSSTISILVVPTNGLIDALVIQEVNRRKPKAVYGHQVFAPIGFMMCSLASGLAIEWFQGGQYISKYTGSFFVAIPINLMLVLATCIHPNRTIYKMSRDPTVKSGSWLELFKHCRNVETIIFLITVFICGTSNFIVIGYLTVLLEELNTSKALTGFILAFASFAEIIALISVNYIKKVLRTKFICLQIAVLSFALRFFLFSILKNPYLFLLAQLLQAFGYGLFWVTAVEYVEQNAPNHIKMTMFNLQQQVYLSFGGIIGNIGGGLIYKHFGGRKVFFISSIICAVWTVCLTLYIIFGKKKQTEEQNQQIKEISSLL